MTARAERSAVRVRRATPTDRDTVLTLHRALYVTHRDSVMPAELAELYAYRDFERVLADDVEALLHASDAVVLLAELAETTVGYISGRIEVDPRRVLPRRGVVEDWFVVPETRGRGIGRLLFATLCDAFRDAGCQLVESATQPFNVDARAAHAALGFHEVEIRYRRRL
ncbi:MAG: GNAT family N-acetyltransferase [Myxococcales bacterium]|nr:GNAT family N-acetyltransferase [Myxococcales bacterium]